MGFFVIVKKKQKMPQIFKKSKNLKKSFIFIQNSKKIYLFSHKKSSLFLNIMNTRLDQSSPVQPNPKKKYGSLGGPISSSYGGLWIFKKRRRRNPKNKEEEKTFKS